MPFYGLSNFFNKLRRPPRRKASTHRTFELPNHSPATDTIAIVSEPVLARSSFTLPSSPSPQESTVISTIYRNTSDAAQAFLPSVQAVADIVPGAGSIIKGAIGGTLSVLQLVDVIRLRSPSHGITPDAEPRHHRDTSKIKKTWRSSPSDYTSFATI